MNEPEIKIFESLDAMAETLAREFREEVSRAADSNQAFYTALSGGSTPQMWFRRLSENPFRESIDWKAVHFFWGDERCVPPDDPESNFGMANRLFIDRIGVPEQNVHRILGENDPAAEARRYSGVIQKFLPAAVNHIPRFDWILLGMGDDGHTASLFPDSPSLQVRDQLCTMSRHPESGQNRISFTLPLINSAARITFMVKGESKREKVLQIISRKDGFRNLPAAQVSPRDGKLQWYLDREAAALLSDTR